MDVAVARRRLITLTAATSAPVLTADEVEDLLVASRRADANGLVYGDTEWAGVYDIYAAAAKGWEIKASKAAAEFDFSADGASFTKGAVYERCLEMAARMRAQAGTGVPGYGSGGAGTMILSRYGYGGYNVWDVVA